ncbi:MAG: hypothetical protein ACKVP5_18815 [Aestuariivirga sp.]
MGKLALDDPLGIARVVTGMHANLLALGYDARVSSDLALLDATKQAVRNERVAPFYDPSVSSLGPDRAFWMSLIDSDGKVIGLQAFRLDFVETNLGDWGPSYIIGLYMRRNEILVPTHASPPRNSIAERIRGRLVYHGELWLDRSVKNRRVFDQFGKFGMLLSLIKWNPDAIWGLAAQQMATHGHVTRMGYSFIERGFLRWQWVPEGIDPVEWLAVAERDALEQLVDEALTSRELLSPPERPRSQL